MSYILEALKKAQAERQLGNAPTIHAPQPVPQAAAGQGGGRKPLFIGLGAGALVVAAGALLFWRQGPAPVSTVQVAAAAAVPAAPAASGGAASATLEVSAPPLPPPHREVRPAPPEADATTAATQAAAPAAARQPAAAPVPAPMAAAAQPPSPAPGPARPATAPAAPAPEDSLPFLQQLPDTIQRDIPRVAFGGYMYSANPADRLLIVDKALRHEGEEVAPGLVLDKLLPRAAVMNFKGIRYRVAY